MIDRTDRENLAQMAHEAAERRATDPLLNFEPHKKQRPFIQSVLQSLKKENWLIAANRCITPWTPIETAVGERQILELLNGSGFDVQSWGGDSQCAKKASTVFLKSIEPALRLHLDNGQTFEATCKHRVLTSEGWFSLGTLLSTQGGPRCSGTFANYPANYDKECCLCGRVPQWDLNIGLNMSLLASGVHPDIQLVAYNEDVAESRLERIHACLTSFPHSTPDDPDLILALCDLWRDPEFANVGRLSPCRIPDVLQSAGVSGPQLRAAQDQEAPIVACNTSLTNGVRLIAYQRIGLRPIVDFTVEDTSCYWASGVLHHNSGKSDGGAYCGSYFARFGRGGSGRPTSGWVSALDFPTSRDVIQPKYFDNGHVPPGATHDPFIPEREIARFDREGQILHLKNGSLIGFKSAESGRKKYQGAEKDWIHFDEEHPREIYEEAVIRVGAYELSVFHTVTLLPPEGQAGGVSWAFPLVIEPWKQGNLPDFGLFEASIYDNPYIPRKEIEFLESLYPEGSIQRRIRLNGEWLPGLAGARAYTAFMRRLHVREQPPINMRRPLAWIWDFNVEPMVSLIGQHDGNLFRIFRELIIEEGSIPDMCEYFRQVHPQHRAEVYVYGDARGRDRSHQSNQTSYTMILNEMNRYGPLRVLVPERNPGVRDRVNSLNNALKNERGEITLEIDPSCTELCADLEQVLLDPRTMGIKKTYNKKDPYNRRTHTSDALGYWTAYENPVQPARARSTSVKIPMPGYNFG